jgi:copper chaperone
MSGLWEVVKIQNLKCHGCANTITNQLIGMDGVSKVTVNVENNEVHFDCSDESQLRSVYDKLVSMGYPPEGADNKLSTKAKSFVSCAIGRMT